MTDIDFLKTSDYITSILRSMICGEKAEEKPEDVSWENVFMLSRHHSFSNAVYSFAEAEIKSEASENLISHWQKERDIDIAKSISQANEFKRVTELFEKEKIPFLPLKGIYLSSLYPNFHLRTMADIDIFVSNENVCAAIDLLTCDGYRLKGDPNGSAVHVSLKKPPFINIELHKYLYEGSDFSFDNCRLRPESSYWYEMDDRDFFIFLIRHAKKHYSHGGCGIRTVLDIHLYKEKNKELVFSPEVENILKEEELYDFFTKILSLGDKWFLKISSDTDLSDFELFIVTGGVYGTMVNRFEYSFKEHGTWRYILSLIFPKKEIIYLRFPFFRKYRFLLPLGYVVRIFASIFNGRVKKIIKAIKTNLKTKNSS